MIEPAGAESATGSGGTLDRRFPLGPPSDGPLPGEVAGPPTGEIPLARPRDKAGAGSSKVPDQNVGGGGGKGKVAGGAKPQLAERESWARVEETSGRRFFALLVMLTVIGLYGWMLSFYYAGAHGGVDQASYLMTARLMVGEYNVGDPLTTAKPVPAKPETQANDAPAVWGGGGRVGVCGGGASAAFAGAAGPGIGLAAESAELRAGFAL